MFFKWKKLEDILTISQPLRYPGNCGVNGVPAVSPSLFFGDWQNGNICVNDIFNPVLISEIVLPNGTSYKFTYNVYGEIDKILYPTGAYERFEYGQIFGTSWVGDPYNQTNRGVLKKWLSKDGSSSTEILWQYSSPLPGNVQTTSPDGNRSERVYKTVSSYPGYGFEDKAAGSLLEEKLFNSNNNLLRRSLYDYILRSTFSGNVEPRKIREISLVFENESSSALATLTEMEYEVPGQNGIPTDPDYFAHLNLKQTKTYDLLPVALTTAKTADINTIKNLFYQSGHVSALSQIDYLYDANYKQRGIIGLPIQTRTLNPSNPADILSKSEALYDEQGQYYSMVDYGPTTGYEAPTGTFANLRGHPTTKRTWNKDTNTWIVTHTQFDNFGNVRKVWDTTGDQTRYIETDYDPLYKFAYPTKVKAPPPDPTGIHGMTTGSEIVKVFDFTTGLVQSITDANGQIATIEYDSLLRPKKVTPAAGGSTSETIYNDDVNNIWIKTRQQIDGNNWAEQTTFFDKLARPYKTKTKDLQGDVVTEVKYDSLGRVEKRSNPYRQGEQIFWSKSRYDDLGRVLELYAPALDGQQGASVGTVKFGISTLSNFVGPYIVSTDASGRKSRMISNIYGIARVDEPANVGGTVDADLGTIENPHQPTFYTRNMKGELTKITQGNPSQTGQPIQIRYFMYDSFGRVTRVRQPEQTPNSNLVTSGNPENNQWTAAYTYDLLGNLIKFTDAKGINIIIEYDKGGRPTSRCYTKPDTQTTATHCTQLSQSQVSLDTPQVDYYYDGEGLPQVPQFSRGALTKVTSAVSENRYTSFDNNGRLLASQQITDGQTYDFAYKYNLSGGLIEETYPSGRIVKNFLDSDGGLATVSSKAATGLVKTLATSFDYSATGSVRKMMLGNGRWETAQFNERFQLTQIGLGNSPTDQSLWKVDYEYGELNADGNTVDAVKNVGNIARQTTTIPTTSFVQSYRYDALNRLTEAKETGASGTQNWKQDFGYDRFGNRTSRYQKVGNDVLPINNLTLPNIDPETNRFVTGQGYAYDFNGNLIVDSHGRTFTFNGDDKQTQVKDATQTIIGTYSYDGSGARVKKVANTETTIFVYDAGGKLAAEYSTHQSAEPTTSYLTAYHLGSPRVITDKMGGVISHRDFMPFGEEIYAGVGSRTTSLKYSTVGADNIRKRFTGYEKDTETDLDFAQARMYENQHGRFTTVDPLMASASPVNPQTFNRYTHTGNNPINYTDPSGLRWVSDANNEIYWIDDNEALNGREDVTGQTILLGGGCDKVAGCVRSGTKVTFNKDRSITIESNESGNPVINEAVEVVDAAIEIVQTTVSEITSTIGFSSGPTTDAPTIELPTGGDPGGGPLEPIGGPDAGGEPDVGGGDIEAGSSGDWKVTAAQLLYFIGNVCWQTSCWESDDEDEGDYVYRGLAETDNPDNGLFARSPDEGNAPISHVAGQKASQWISTTADENIARGKYDKGFGVVRIDLNEVNNEIVDLTNGIPNGGRFSNYAKADKEILIKNYIPPKAIARLP